MSPRDETHQLSPEESVAKGIVLLINDLFGIDAQARAHNLNLAERDRLRQQHARPLLDVIRRHLEAAREQALPASKLGGAVAYTLGQWERLKRFLNYPDLELSNNLAENSMRGWRWAGRTGFTSVACRLGLKWRPFFSDGDLPATGHSRSQLPECCSAWLG
jgi:hypothetical protein